MSEHVYYREIEESDMEAIFDVRIATWHNPNGHQELTQFGITPASVRERMQTSLKGWLCDDGQKVIGFAMGDQQNGEMWVIAVLQEFENQGIGRELLTRVENWLFSCGWNEIWLTTDPDEDFRAVGFYRRLGWTDWKLENGDRFMRKRQPGIGSRSL